MATSYPGTIQAIPNYAGTAITSEIDHAGWHNTTNDTVEAIQEVLGTTAGTSVLKDFGAGDFSAKTNNETFGTPTIEGGTASNITLNNPNISTIINSGTVTLPTSTDTLVGRDTTDTLTKKRITRRTGTTTSSATPTINTDNVDFYSITAQAEDITSFTTNLSGTPTENQTLWIAITGTAARAITWGSSFEASESVALPTTTVTTKRLDVGFVWNTVTGKWRCVASA